MIVKFPNKSKLVEVGRLLKDMGIPVYVYTHPYFGSRSADDRYLDIDFIRSRYMLIYNGSVALNIRALSYPSHEVITPTELKWRF
jgi:hypothetical protein